MSPSGADTEPRAEDNPPWGGMSAAELLAALEAPERPRPSSLAPSLADAEPPLVDDLPLAVAPSQPAPELSALAPKLRRAVAPRPILVQLAGIAVAAAAAFVGARFGNREPVQRACPGAPTVTCVLPSASAPAPAPSLEAKAAARAAPRRSAIRAALPAGRNEGSDPRLPLSKEPDASDLAEMARALAAITGGDASRQVLAQGAVKPEQGTSRPLDAARPRQAPRAALAGRAKGDPPQRLDPEPAAPSGEPARVHGAPEPAGRHPTTPAAGALGL